jgi:flavodoxin-like protein
MNALVVYESLYGNTRQIADAIAEGLRDTAHVDVVAVGDASASVVDTADMLVVGGPTHIHGLTSNVSRKGARNDAAKQGLPEPDVAGPPLRGWFDGIQPLQQARAAAAFDTRIGKPKLLTGSAASGIARRLRRRGYHVVAEESFIVDDTAGPLQEGELERARSWGRALPSRH